MCLARESLGVVVEIGTDLVLPTWVVVRVFRYFNMSTLGKLCSVNKTWKRVAENNVFWRSFCFKQITWENLIELDVNYKLMRQCQVR